MILYNLTNFMQVFCLPTISYVPSLSEGADFAIRSTISPKNKTNIIITITGTL